MAKKAIRPIRIEGNVAYVPLTRGHEAIIDAADVSLVVGCNWCAIPCRRSDGSVRTVYAGHVEPTDSDKRRFVLMHRVIAGTPKGAETDHIDGDGLNNRRSNIRNATKAQNQHNQRLAANNTSGVKGVSWHRLRSRWQARIKFGGKEHCLGYFTNIEAAADAYAKASARLHGEFGRTQ